MSGEMGIRVEANEWPWGLRCAACDRALEDGHYYSELLAGVAPGPCTAGGCEARPIVELVCVSCAL